MRKLTSKYEEEKKRRRNQWIAGGILIIVMVFSTLGYAIQGALGNSSASTTNSSQTAKYNGYEFQLTSNNLWGVGNYIFRYLPNQVPLVNSTVNSATTYQSYPLYVYSEDDIAKSEVYVNLGQFAQRIQDACPDNKTCSENVPTKNCSDKFIIIEVSNSTNASITQNQGCVYIEGSQENLIKLTDEFLFKTLGIM